MSGFFFQQRTGRIDLKQLSDIDIDRVIRETDIDLLQLNLENLTFRHLDLDDLRVISDPDIIKLFRISQLIIEYLLFSQDSLAGTLRGLSKKYADKKRLLALKRKESIELKESTRQLKVQLISKKKSIDALERLLQNASRTRENKLNQVINDSNFHSNVKGSNLNETSPIIHFYVTCPDGLCIECRYKRSMKIFELKAEVRRTISNRENREQESESQGGIRLIYRGKVMNEDLSLAECYIQQDDSIFAVIDQNDTDTEGRFEKRAATMAEAAVTALAAANSTNTSPEILEILKGQQDMVSTLSEEIRKHHDEVRTMRANKDGEFGGSAYSELLMKLDDRWSKMEINMRQQLDSQLSHYNELLKESQDRRYLEKSLLAGDLEDDDEREVRMREDALRREYQGKLHASNSRIATLEAELKATGDQLRKLYEMQEGNSGEIKLVRQQLSKRGSGIASANSTTITASSTVNDGSIDKVSGLKKRKSGKGSTDKDKADKADKAGPPMPAMPRKTSDDNDSSNSSSTIIIEPVSTLTDSSPTLDVFFQLPFNVDLADFVNKFVSVTIAKAASVHDIIFTLRTSIATQTNLPLSRIYLTLEGVNIEQATDVPSNMLSVFNAQSIQDLVERGELTAHVHKKQILSVNAMTDDFQKIISDAKESLMIKSISVDGESLRGSVQSLNPDTNVVSTVTGISVGDGTAGRMSDDDFKQYLADLEKAQLDEDVIEEEGEIDTKAVDEINYENGTTIPTTATEDDIDMGMLRDHKDEDADIPLMASIDGELSSKLPVSSASLEPVVTTVVATALESDSMPTDVSSKEARSSITALFPVVEDTEDSLSQSITSTEAAIELDAKDTVTTTSGSREEELNVPAKISDTKTATQEAVDVVQAFDEPSSMSLTQDELITKLNESESEVESDTPTASPTSDDTQPEVESDTPTASPTSDDILAKEVEMEAISNDSNSNSNSNSNIADDNEKEQERTETKQTETINRGLVSTAEVDSVRGSTELGRTNESIITMDTVESVEDSVVSDIDLGMSGALSIRDSMNSMNSNNSMNVASSAEIAEQRADDLERRASEMLSADHHNEGMTSPTPTYAGGQGLMGSPSPFRALADNNDIDNNDVSNEDETLNFSTSTASNN